MHDCRGVHHAVQVCGFCCRGWTFHVDQLQWAELGQDKQKASQHVGSDSRMAAIFLPVVFRGYHGHFLVDLRCIGRIRLWRFVAAMQECDGVGHAGEEGMHHETIFTNVEALTPG